MDFKMKSDFLVVGSGIAGLSFALKASRLGTVNIITKKKQLDTATNLAQGGVAAVLHKTDNFSNHVRDTLLSGADLCDEEVVNMVIESGPARIEELINIGVDFVKNNDGSLSLGKEGGHSERRVAHSYDLTGREIERALIEKVKSEPNIKMFENHCCLQLITDEGDNKNEIECKGAFVLEQGGLVVPYLAKQTLLCTGGVGKVYLFTTNPDIATGDGVALAYRAGAVATNMEFIQFHPTCLYHLNAKNFLISEAVRGEGAILVNGNNERFMELYEPVDKELATRDKVARAIDKEMKKTGADCVYLDISHKDSAFIKKRFPAIYEKCRSLGIDITKDPIPVVPAAHYLCGGILTDKYGKTNVQNLFCLGESACTGLHGGNRLASNSLLEALVYAENAYYYCSKYWNFISKNRVGGEYSWENQGLEKIDEEILINHNWDVIRRIMWNYVGIVRKKSRLEIAEKRISEMRKEINSLFSKYKVTSNMMELKNITLVASLIISASLQRKES